MIKQETVNMAYKYDITHVNMVLVFIIQNDKKTEIIEERSRFIRNKMS